MATTLSLLDITCTKRNLIFKRYLSHFSLRVHFLRCEQPTNYEWMQPGHFQIQISFKILFGIPLLYSFYSYISNFVFFISVNILLGHSLWTSCKMYLIGPVFNCSRTSVGSVQSQYRNRYINLQFFFIFTSLNKQ